MNRLKNCIRVTAGSILESTFIGYALFYFVRDNVKIVQTEMQNVLHYNYSMVGNIMAVTAVSYGIGNS
jgi:OPA family glycerol-3-phosphate transporter-like MFS transporter